MSVKSSSHSKNKVDLRSLYVSKDAKELQKKSDPIKPILAKGRAPVNRSISSLFFKESLMTTIKKRTGKSGNGNTNFPESRKRNPL